jgi:hypothetical protein
MDDSPAMGTTAPIPLRPSVADLLLAEQDNNAFARTLLVELHKNPYAVHAVYLESVKHRLAMLRRESPEIYHGIALTAIAAILKERTREWDQEIKSLALAQAQMDIVSLDQIAPEEIIWLWEPYIPLKKITLFEGDPASGKTYLLLAIAAAITNGYALPDQEGHVGQPCETSKQDVLYITAEDGLADTIRVRAEKVGADLRRIFVPREPQSFALAEPSILRNAIERFRPKLVILDPLQAFLGADVDMYRTNEVRPLMTTLLSMAIHFDCAIIAVRHWTKAVGGRARHRGQGNVDFAAAARSVLSIGESPSDPGLRIMAQAKISLAGLGASIVFQITDHGLEWAGTSTITADELSMAQPTIHREQRKDAMKWLRDYLKDTSVPAETIKEAAKVIGLTDKMLRTARERLGVLTSKQGAVWYWRLPIVQKWERERYPGDEEEGEF